jgi:hypothetical protein
MTTGQMQPISALAFVVLPKKQKTSRQAKLSDYSPSTTSKESNATKLSKTESRRDEGLAEYWLLFFSTLDMQGLSLHISGLLTLSFTHFFAA